MLGAKGGIDDVESLLAALEAIFDEWKEHSVFFIGIMKKRADVTLLVKHGAREPNRLAGFTRRSSTGLQMIMSGIHNYSFDRQRLTAAARGIEKSRARLLALSFKTVTHGSALYAWVDAKRFYAHCSYWSRGFGEG